MHIHFVTRVSVITPVSIEERRNAYKILIGRRRLRWKAVTETAFKETARGCGLDSSGTQAFVSTFGFHTSRAGMKS